MGIATAAVGLLTLLGCAEQEEAAPSQDTGTTAPLAPLAPLAPTSQPGETASTDSPTSTTATTRAPTGTTGAPVTTAGSVSSSTAPQSAGTTLPGLSGDFSVTYPPGWAASGQMQATAFAAGATCGSALIVDRANPEGSGPGAQVEQSYVQVCGKGLDGKTLPDFMSSTYGSTGGFQATTLAGRPAFVSRAGTASTSFVDTSSRRYQVVTGVTASAELRPMRLAQVEQIVGSLTLPN
ncbi:MAG: hypothetical protein ACRD2W_13205 [Acidimicrobiales bacterium]